MIVQCGICNTDHATNDPCPVVRPGGVGTETHVVAPGRSALAAAVSIGVSPPPAKQATPAPDAAPTVQLYATPAAPPPPIDPEHDPMIGTTIGSFKVVRKLGVGGMGTVYLGEQSTIGSKVAIKLLHEHLASNVSLVQRFYAEARAANVIGHEHIVTIIDLNLIPPNRYYFIMEYLEGKALSELQRPVSHALLVHVLSQVCDALQAAHTHGVVHRDLKPENIILIKRGRNDHFAKILDFGIAKLFATELAGQRTAAGMIMGTPEFMAPEQTAADTVDGRTDVYSLGVIAYEMATGKLPFTGSNVADLLIAHRIQKPQPPHELNPALPVGVSMAILRALAKKPIERWQSADEFREALEATMEGVAPYRSSTAAAPPGRVAPPQAPAPFSAASSYNSNFSPPPGAPGGRPASSTTPAPPPRSGHTPRAMPVVPSRQTPRSNPSISSGSSSAGKLFTAPTPQPNDSRHVASWETKVFDQPNNGFRMLRSTDVSRGGMFLHTEGPFPSMFARFKVALLLPDGEFPLKVEVVRQVTLEQSRAWGMAVGFGVQFIELTPAQRDDLGNLMKGLPRFQSSVQRPDEKDDPKVEEVLSAYKKRISGTHYDLLAVFEDVDFADVRQRVREAKKVIAELRGKAPSGRQSEQLDSLDKRFDEAALVIGHPKNRLDYDSARSNWKGVARCIAGGVSVSDLDQARRKFLASHERVEGTAHLHYTTASAWESQKEFLRAQQEFERALALDPLNLTYHQRYQALRRVMTAPPPPPRK
jgi:eukaryotic-like serine/threonine-protein kinase